VEAGGVEAHLADLAFGGLAVFGVERVGEKKLSLRSGV